MFLQEKPIPIKKNVRISLILTILLFIFWRLDFLFAFILHGFVPWIKNFIIVVIFFCISTKAYIELYHIVLNIKKIRLVRLIPFTILFLGLGWTLSNPLNINYELLKGKVIFRACYEEEKHLVTVKLREAGRFEIHTKGPFFYEEYFLGKYQIQKDSLYLKYRNRNPEFFSDVLYIDEVNNYLVPVNKNDTSNTIKTITYDICVNYKERGLIIE